MKFNKTKNVLLVIGMENGLEQLIQQAPNMNQDNMLILKSFGPVVSQPYGDLMRDIIFAVYEENTEEIYIVGTKDNKEDTVNAKKIVDIISEEEGLAKQIETLDYLFKNCIPEFHGGSVIEWLEGSKTVVEGIEKSVNMIRHHPLIPSHVKVHGLVLDRENGNLTEIKV
jgi:carbonic anhydrase